MGSDGKIMTNREQLDRWVAGESVHNGATPEVGECCPDFSCCIPDTNTPQEAKEAFRDAFLSGDEKKAMGFLMGFLTGGPVAECQEVKVHIGGQGEGE